MELKTWTRAARDQEEMESVVVAQDRLSEAWNGSRARLRVFDGVCFSRLVVPIDWGDLSGFRTWEGLGVRVGGMTCQLGVQRNTRV